MVAAVLVAPFFFLIEEKKGNKINQKPKPWLSSLKPTALYLTTSKISPGRKKGLFLQKYLLY